MGTAMQPRHPAVAVISINAIWNFLNFRQGLIRALQSDGYRVVALAPDDTHRSQLEALGVEFHAIAIDSKGLSPVADLRLLARYRTLLTRLRPTILLGYTIKPNIYGSLAAASLGIPVINNVSGLGTAFVRGGWLMRFVSLLYRIGLTRSATVFFQNDEDRALFVDRRLVRPDQTEVLPGSGIDTRRFQSVPAQPKDSATFLLVARLLRDKGVGEFVAAARAVRDEFPAARFQLLGFLDVVNATAIPRSEVEAWVAKGVIEYLGDTDDVRPFIAAADCIVLPSYREGLPRSLLEAGAMARPSIASDVPGCRTIVRDGVNGLLCAPRSAVSLAETMKRFLALSSDERIAMGERARAIVTAEYDERVVVEQIMAAVERAVCR